MSEAAAQRKRSRAFSLVETVLAMGVVSFAMLGILGLVPLGLNNFRDAVSFTAESNIVQGLSNDLLLSDYDALLLKYAGGPQKYYYDDQGIELPTATATGKIYNVSVNLHELDAPDMDVAAGRTAVIDIENIKAPGVVKKYTILIPKG